MKTILLIGCTMGYLTCVGQPTIALYNNSSYAYKNLFSDEFNLPYGQYTGLHIADYPFIKMFKPDSSTPDFSIDLKLNYTFKFYPIQEYYVSGRYFLTLEEASYTPPFYLQNEYLVIPYKKEE